MGDDNNARGEYLQALTYPGAYMIFCEKEKVGSATGRTNVKMGTWTQADIRLITWVLAP